MNHGIQGYFEERARFDRRVAAICAALSATGLLALWLVITSPPLRKALLDSTRFGYEGPDQFVRRIEIQQFEGVNDRLRDIGSVKSLTGRRGGSVRGPLMSHPHAAPETRPRERISGDAEAELLQRAVSRRADVPVVRSEDLIIDHLVRPAYPPPLLEQNIEGKVTLQALVDTLGQVVDVQIMTSSGEILFEQSAADAVRQCRFRPFKRAGVSSEVYAMFRFSFRIYD